MQAGPLSAIAQRVGHSSVAVTGDIYSHVSPEMRGDTAATAAASLAPNWTPGPFVVDVDCRVRL